MPNRKRRIILAILGAAGAVWLASFLVHLWRYESTDDAYVSGHLHAVSPQIDGQVKEVLVRENQSVEAGQILVRLDPVPFEIALAKAQAGLARANASEIQAEAEALQASGNLAQARASVAQADAELDQARAQARLAQINLDRDRRLDSGETKAVTPAELDTASAAFDSAQAAVEAARAQRGYRLASVASAEGAERAAQAAVQAARAGSAAAEASVRDAERDVGYTAIVAPAAGRIGAKNVEVGNRVQTGQTLLVLVEPRVWIEANFKETQLARMRPGLPAEISIDALSGRTFPGHIDSIAPASGAEFALLPPDNATGNFTKVVQRVPVRILLDPDAASAFADHLFPGLSAVVEVKVR